MHLDGEKSEMRLAENHDVSAGHLIGSGRLPGSARWLGVWVLALGLELVLSQTSPAETPATDAWVGKRIVQRFHDFTLRIENQLVDHKQLILFYQVEQSNGPWLWLKAEGKALKGWARADHVVPADQGVDFFTEQIRKNPQVALPYVMRATLRHDRNEVHKALADYNEAIRLDPRNADAYHHRGLSWSAKKDYDKAIADYDQAIQLNPRFDRAYVRRAWLRVSCPDAKYRDPQKAIESATKPCELTEWREAYNLGTLAAAHAEAGNFDAAAKWQTKATELSARGSSR